jgi:DegV family protein with EDD domain
VQKVRIVTHSGCDISFAEAEANGIIMLPDLVIFGNQQYRNNIDIQPKEFFRRLESDAVFPTSAHPSLSDFMDAFRTAGDCEDIICIVMSAKMTGTFNTVTIAAQLLREEGFLPRIHIYDSMQVSFGMGIAVLSAAHLANFGATANEILHHLDELVPRIGVYFVMQSLKYAKKGGRIGAIKAVTADTLGIKPLLTFQDGTVSDISLNRSFHAGISSVFKKYCAHASADGEVFIFHADNEAGAQELSALIRQQHPLAQLRIRTVGPAVGLYTGTGCVGVAFKKKEA